MTNKGRGALHKRFMRRALVLARRGGRAAAPNPMVGCVIAKDGRVIAEGYHAKFGGPHAEALALKKAGTRAQGAAVYVSLEPCVEHKGKKTPSCAKALVQAGVREVFAAAVDPNPEVSGRGLRLLRHAGVRVQVGLMAQEARELNRGFFTRMRLKRPYVILKAALSLDGRAYAQGGSSRWITGASSRAKVHLWRAQADAVLVGSGTALADDPALTSHGAGPDPVRVVLDTRLRLGPKARLLDGAAPTWIFTASPERLPGAEVIRVPAKGGRLNLRAVLLELARRGIGTLLVEGGPTVHAAFLAQGLADEARIFIAPKLISGSRDPNAAPGLLLPRLEKIGADFLFSGRLSCSRA